MTFGDPKKLHGNRQLKEPCGNCDSVGILRLGFYIWSYKLVITQETHCCRKQNTPFGEEKMGCLLHLHKSTGQY